MTASDTSYSLDSNISSESGSSSAREGLRRNAAVKRKRGRSSSRANAGTSTAAAAAAAAVGGSKRQKATAGGAAALHVQPAAEVPVPRRQWEGLQVSTKDGGIICVDGMVRGPCIKQVMLQPPVQTAQTHGQLDDQCRLTSSSSAIHDGHTVYRRLTLAGR
jgi:hypothetical protein